MVDGHVPANRPANQAGPAGDPLGPAVRPRPAHYLTRTLALAGYAAAAAGSVELAFVGTPGCSTVFP
jgi:hypothetical protein